MEEPTLPPAKPLEQVNVNRGKQTIVNVFTIGPPWPASSEHHIAWGEAQSEFWSCSPEVHSMVW